MHAFLFIIPLIPSSSGGLELFAVSIVKLLPTLAGVTDQLFTLTELFNEDDEDGLLLLLLTLALLLASESRDRID